VVAILMTRNQLRRELAGWLGPAGGGLLGCGGGLAVHSHCLLPGVPMAAVGVALILLAWRRDVREMRARTREHILLTARIWPGLQAHEISNRSRIKPWKLRPLLDQLVADGELVRDRAGEHSTYRAVEQPTVR
jgi:hypothetical protein